MVVISEWLPNPAGNDATQEWVELWNGGSAPVNLSGWLIKTQGGSKYKLSGSIGAGQYLVLKRTDTKLVLKNTDEALYLYDASGKLVNESGYLGSAPEGKSYSLANYDNNDNYTWSEPTPSAINAAAASLITINRYPLGTPLNKQLGGSEFLGLMLGTAIVLAGLVTYAAIKNETLRKLFFGGDERIR